MKKTVFLRLYCLIAGIVFLSCDWGGLWDERRVSQIGVVVKTADSTFEYEVECPISNLKDKTRTITRTGTSATCMQYVWHRGGKDKRDNSYIVLSRLTSPKNPVEVCVYDYMACSLKEIIDDERKGEAVVPSSDSVFNKLREDNYEHLYTWDPKDEKLVIPLYDLLR